MESPSTNCSLRRRGHDGRNIRRNHVKSIQCTQVFYLVDVPASKPRALVRELLLRPTRLSRFSIETPFLVIMV